MLWDQTISTNLNQQKESAGIDIHSPREAQAPVWENLEPVCQQNKRHDTMDEKDI